MQGALGEDGNIRDKGGEAGHCVEVTGFCQAHSDSGRPNEIRRPALQPGGDTNPP